MKCMHYQQIEDQEVAFADAKGVTVRIAIGEAEKAPNFVMRVFTVEPDGHTPRHSHDFEHETFFYEGKGEVFCEGKTKPVESGSVAYIPPNVEHQFINTGSKPLVFICVVPKDIKV